MSAYGALDLDTLVQRLYDDVEHASESVLRDVSTWVARDDGTGVQAMVIAQGAVVDVRQWRIDPDASREYPTHWAERDARMAAARARPGVVLTDTADIDRAPFERSAIFNEHLVPNEAALAMFGSFPIGDDLVLAQAFVRSVKDEPFDPEHVKRFQALLPHLRRVTHLRDLVGKLRREVGDLRRALDGLPTAVGILDRTGRILEANGAAERLLREGKLTAQGRLTAPSPDEARALAEALRKALHFADASRVASASNLVGAPTALSRPNGPPLWVLLHPLRPEHTLRTNLGAARLLAIFHDPEARVRVPPALLSAMHGLTPTEASLTSSLVEGWSLVQYAETRGISEQTARTHLKRVLEKTQTGRQVDLVRSVLSSAALNALGR